MKHIKFKIIFLFLCLVSIGGYSQNVKQLFISPSGNDNGNGTIEKPFATLDKARKAVRKMLQDEKRSSITVYLRGGNYSFKNSVVFDSLDAGTENNPITYTAYNNEKVFLLGGISIPTKYATPVKDNAVLES